MNHFKLTTETRSGKNIGILLFDMKDEKVNKFNRAVMQEFESLIAKLKSEKLNALILISSKPGIFIAGADIQLIQSAKDEGEAFELARKGQNLLNDWEDLPYPTIVAINGACMGGGCELSLASTAIVMSNDPAARIGLPETMLGFIPGMGGCVRMPWKIGIAQAFDLILSGKTLTGEKAAKAGLADACLPKEDFEGNVKAWVLAHLDRMVRGERIAKAPKLGGSGGMVGALLENNPLGRSIIFSQARKGVLAKTKGQYPAPMEAIKVIEEIGTGFQAKFKGEKREQALLREAKGFAGLSVTPISKSLVKLFFMTEAVKKGNGLTAGKTSDTVKVTQAGVLGAGVMGGGIAQLFADKGVSVRMKDIQNTALEIGVQSALKLFKKALKRKSITDRQYSQKLNRIAPTTSFDGWAGVEAVVEAVVEKMEIKQAVLKDLEMHVSDSCVIASNTSSLSVSKMQSVMAKPERFVGMHFFNPVHKMPLVEVIRGDASSDHAVSQVFQLAKQLGKTPIVVKDSAGFLVNRLLMPYLGESAIMLSEGVRIEELDPALLDFGMPMGPIELIDEVGLDVAEKVGHILHDAFGERMNPPNTFEKLLQAKRLGKKTGSGFYLYVGKDKSERKMDPEIYSILGISPVMNKITTQEMVERCVYGMINEAARCLDEKIVETPDDVDLGMIMGTGFPPFRGGLMRYADSVGLNQIVTSLNGLKERYGMRFTPSDAIRRFAKLGSFYRD